MTPAILLTGFLGAGKTTLLNHLIDFYKSRRTVLLINEFGTAGIDGKRLKNGNYQKIELNRGSLFCICIRSDFISELKKIAVEMKPDLLIIEATGLADTTEMEKMLSLRDIQDNIILKACICIVDARSFLKVKKFAMAPVSQVKSADIILINKTDLVSEKEILELEKNIRGINSKAALLRTVFSEFSFDMIEAVNRSKPSTGLMPGNGFPDPFKSVTLETEGSFSASSFQKLLNELKPDMLRLKGFVKIDGDWFYADGDSTDVSLTRTEPSDKRLSTLVFIGKGINADSIKEIFSACITDSNHFNE